MTATLGERVKQLRAASMVGREAELKRLWERLVGHPGILFVHGPAGVGKTVLLRTFAEQARGQGFTVREVSARAFLSDPERELASLSGEGVLLLVDDLQEMATWQEWLRESCLPRLPAGVGVALAGGRTLAVTLGARRLFDERQRLRLERLCGTDGGLRGE